MEDLLISVCSPPEIDVDIYSLWIDGFTPDEVAKISPFRGNLFEFSYRVEESSADMMRMFQYDIEDQFRCFEVLEHYLMQPYLLRSQSVCSVSPELHAFMIEKYWSLDDSFIRELLNKKLTKSRKDLEDASETTGLHIRSVMRQFDNIKRIYAAYEDTTNLSGNAYQFISKTCLISSTLAKKYTCLIYLMDSKFNLTSKKRLMKVPYPSLEVCAAVTMSCLNVDASVFSRILQADALSDPSMFLENSQFAWSYVWRVFPSIEQFEVDKQLLISMRDLRTVLTGEMLDAGCQAVRSRLPSSVLRKLEGSVSFGYSTSTRLRNVIKGILTIGSNLSQTKEFRDLYEDILTKVAEPLEECGVTPSEMTSIISACYFAAQDIPDLGKGTSSHHSHHQQHHQPPQQPVQPPLQQQFSSNSNFASNLNNYPNNNNLNLNINTTNINNSSAMDLTQAAQQQQQQQSPPSSTPTNNSNITGTQSNVYAMGSINNATNVGGTSVRSSEGYTGRSDVSLVSAAHHQYSSVSNAGNMTNSSVVNYSTMGTGATNSNNNSSRLQSRAYNMRADWLRFLVFCKLTLTELMMVDRRL